MSQNSTVKTYSLFAVLLFLGCLVGAYYLFTSFWPAYTLAKNQYVNVQAESTRLTKAVESSKSFAETYKQQISSAQTLALALPVSNPDQANFVSGLSQIAQQSGATLLNLAFNPTESETSGRANAIQVMDLTLTATGTYPSFKDFMSRVEQHLRLMDVYNVSIATSGAEGKDSPPLQYTVKMRTYYQQ